MSDHPVLTPSPAVVRASAVLAVVGGGLRVANSFTTDVLPGGVLALLYLVTDVFRWLASRACGGDVAGHWELPQPPASWSSSAEPSRSARRPSACSARPATRSARPARCSDWRPYSIETLLRRGAAPWAPVLWLVSLVCAMVGVVGVAPPILTIAAGVAFGAGFVAAGVEMLAGRSETERTDERPLTACRRSGGAGPHHRWWSPPSRWYGRPDRPTGPARPVDTSARHPTFTRPDASSP